MGLITRTTLLLALIYLAVVIGAGMKAQELKEPSGIDRLVYAREYRQILAARTASIEGGSVASPVSASKATEGHKAADNVPIYRAPGDKTSKRFYSRNFSLKMARDLQHARTKFLADISGLTTEELSAKLAELNKDRVGNELSAKDFGLGDGAISDLRKANSDAAAKIAKDILGFNDHSAQMRRFAVEVAPFAEGLKTQALNIVDMQNALHILDAENVNIDASIQSVKNQSARIKASAAALENQMAQAQREHVRISELLARYPEADPSIASKVNMAGKPWVRAQVTWAGSDSRAGVMKISIGSNDGVANGQVLSLIRNGRFVARASVYSLRSDFALLRLENAFLGVVTPRVGDTVVGRPNLSNK